MRERRGAVAGVRGRALNLESIVIRHVNQRAQAASLDDGHTVLPVGREIAQRESGVTVALGVFGARETDEWRGSTLLDDVLIRIL